MALLRRFLLLLVLVLLVGLGTRAFAATFAGVSGTVFADAFDCLSRQNIVQGYSDGSGRPYGLLNRAEALKVVMSMQETDRKNVAAMQRSVPPLPLFSDIDQTAWYAPYLEAAFQRGIVTGYPDGTFQPSRTLAVEEAIALLLRAHGVRGTSGAAKLSPYIHNQDNQWFTPHLNAAIDRNLLMHQAKLVPGTAITRGQFFDVAYRLHYATGRGSVAFSGSEPRQPVASRSLTQRQYAIGGGGAGTQISVGQPSVTTVAQSSPYGSEKYFAVTMPSIGITDLAVIHPSDPFSAEGVLEPLQSGVGHLFSFPGGGGKVMIYGHSSGYPWDSSEFTKIFRKINELAVGDRVYVTYDGKLHVYEVTQEQTVAASDTSSFNDDGRGEELILYTCWPPDSITQRYLVHAVPVETIALR